jgi:hypothetical protein
MDMTIARGFESFCRLLHTRLKDQSANFVHLLLTRSLQSLPPAELSPFEPTAIRLLKRIRRCALQFTTLMVLVAGEFLSRRLCVS